MDTTIAIVAVTRSRYFFEALVGMLKDLCDQAHLGLTIHADIDYLLSPPEMSPVYREAREKALRFLRISEEPISIALIQAESLDHAVNKIVDMSAAELGKPLRVGLVCVDYADPLAADIDSLKIDRQLTAFYDRLRQSSILFYRQFASAVFTRQRKTQLHFQPMEYIHCVLPDDRSLLQAELLCLWMDFFELSYTNRLVKPQAKAVSNNTLGAKLIEFMSQRAGADWLGFYYTGSLVSNLINYFEVEAGRRGVLMLRGPSEHSLACGAMANWQLYRKPFVIIVTSGMIDEFKGTMANLREARAKGFIVCAENRAEQWFAFQGTVSRDEDTREVLRARRIPHVYLDSVDRLVQDLQKAAELYDANEGPVVILATQAVLDASGHIDLAFPGSRPRPTSLPPAIGSTSAVLDEVMRIINDGPPRLLWQCGAINDEELKLSLSIADRAGIALVDSLIHPGSIPKFVDGKRNRNYLGTLAAYGYSPRVYSYLHTREKINPTADQCLFFLKSKLSQIATPFSEGRLARKLNIVQLTSNADHIAPFADYPLVMSYRAFLEYVDAHLDVSPALRDRRYRIMDAVPDAPSDVVSRLPKIPMSPNYFFHRLNGLIEKLIVERNYDYTGMYDVGRCGSSAVRNIARTRHGFSGWYGRALMGDALQATLSVAYTSPVDVLAFVGDGAKGLVPDVLPCFVENALYYPERMNKNITIFYFLNGGHSIINTYQERILFKQTSRQMRLVNIFSDDWEGEVAGLKVNCRTLNTFDSEILTAALLKRGCINLFSVVVSHNSEGDGLSLATATGWQRDALTVSDDISSIEAETA
ncbi:MAG: biosynthesis protein PigD [Gammaproteobacteria bacterium]|nr:biosynthesis protein PigD [Gammaproteobacteria bacterium]